MWMSAGLAAVSLIALVSFLARSKVGDFVKVEIPRTLGAPLAMGTRLDCAAALKKAGVPREEIAPLVDGRHDQELLDRYWQVKDAAP
jgi:hypothetical protein